VIFFPKDLVSGDFYWFIEIENCAWLAVADCTGHGVPGAFMSMIGNSVLNQLILESETNSPAEALHGLDERIRRILKQDNGQNTDGMDLMLCRFKKEENSDKIELRYAGAKSKFYTLENEDLKIHKGDSISIGGLQSKKKKKFQDRNTVLNRGSILYFFTDGYVDAGNPARKSFGRMRFQELIKQHQTKPLKEQKELLIQALHNHEQGAVRRDDITVVGLKL
jgi:serine phosphatase RsbU (regulator of sigma subunit)